MLPPDTVVTPISEKNVDGRTMLQVINLSILVTLIACGAIFYWWYKTSFEKIREQTVDESIREVQKEIDELRKEVLYFQQNKNRAGEARVTNEYIGALKTANFFLSAIIRKDASGALKYVNPHAKTIYGEEKFKTAVSGLFGDYFQGFEVFDGQLMEENIYQFNVFLYKKTGITNPIALDASKPNTMRVVKDVDGKWYIDSLPESIIQYL